MKRLIITILVVVAHVFVITVLYYGCGSKQSERGVSSDPISKQDSPDINHANEYADQETKAQGSDKDAIPRSGRGGGHSNGLRPSDLKAAVSQLPPELQKKTSQCGAGILVDVEARSIVWQKNPELAAPIASMTKMMTALVLMRSIKENPAFSLSTEVEVSKKTAAIGGRQVYLDPRETFSLNELLKCMMIFSANDAAYLVAEFLGNGQVEKTVARMNDIAENMGLENTEFVTPHGLPAAGGNDHSSPVDLVCIAARLMKYPEVVKWSSTRLDYIRENSKRFNRFQLLNTNKLVSSMPGVNGMKTGYTDAAGFCMTATYERNDEALIVVLMGCPSASVRNELAQGLLKWYLSNSPGN